MKQILLLLAVFVNLLFVSCSKDNAVYESQTVDRSAIIENCVTTKDFQVPVKEGYTTVVKYGNDTLGVTNTNYTIEIPKTATVEEQAYQSPAKTNARTRATTDEEDKVTYTFVSNALMPNHINGYGYTDFWQAVLFEDLPNGDNDYNDLIIHVKKNTNINSYTGLCTISVSIQPIALGSTNTIALGFYTADGVKHQVTNDCRKDLFGGMTGFINTEDYKNKKYFELKEVYNGTYKNTDAIGNVNAIVWYIKSGGNTFYAVSEKVSNTDIQKQTINDHGTPYGLVLYSVLKNYAKETVPLASIYPNFSAWLKGDVTKFSGVYTDDATKVFYSWNKSGTQDLWKY